MSGRGQRWGRPHDRKLWEDWLHRAVCREPQIDPDWFFPETTSLEKERLQRYGGFTASERKAKAACARCPVRRECLTLMYSSGEQEGIWGGTTERERRFVRHADDCDRACGRYSVPYRIVDNDGRELMAGKVYGCRPVPERVDMLLEDMGAQAIRNGFVKEGVA